MKNIKDTGLLTHIYEGQIKFMSLLIAYLVNRMHVFSHLIAASVLQDKNT